MHSPCDRERAMRLVLHHGMSANQAGRTVGTSASTVIRWLEAAGHEYTRRCRPKAFDHDEIYRLRYEEKLKIHEIAARVGCSESHAGRVLRKYKPQARKAGRAPKKRPATFENAALYVGELVDASEPGAFELEAAGVLRQVVSFNPRHYEGRPTGYRYVWALTAREAG